MSQLAFDTFSKKPSVDLNTRVPENDLHDTTKYSGDPLMPTASVTVTHLKCLL